MQKLIVKFKSEEKEYILETFPVIIGREPTCTIMLSDPIASRTHARIELTDNRLMLTDLGSSNGTYVNGTKIIRQPLTANDTIRIGETTLAYIADSGADDSLAFELEESVEALQESILPRARSIGEIPTQAEREDTMFFTLYHIGKVVASAATLDTMIENAIELIFTVINAERGLVMFKDPATGILFPKSVYHRKYGVIPAREIRISSTIVNHVMSERVAVITSDAQHDPRFAAGLSIVQMNIRSAICVPLWDEGEVFGILYLDNMIAAHKFTNDDLTLLTAIGNLIAIRLKQDKLYEQLREETVRRVNLAKYHSPDVVNMLMSQSKAADLDLIEKEVTVLFADVTGSTTLAEQLSPQSFAALLNDFFELTTAAIFENKGHVNKFIGDCVMAIFNAPLDVADHARAAIQTAQKIVQTIVERKSDPARPFQYDVRIGINTGKALIGNVGTANRKEYTVVGDVVNTASRLSKLQEPNHVVISEETLRAAGDSIKTGSIGEVQLKGKGQAVRAYTVTPSAV